MKHIKYKEAEYVVGDIVYYNDINGNVVEMEIKDYKYEGNSYYYTSDYKTYIPESRLRENE